MAEWVRVADVSQCAGEGCVHAVSAKGEAVVLARWEGDIFALEDCCSHEDFLLSEGTIDNGRIECVLHGAMFDLRTGKAVQLPAVRPVRTYPVRIETGDLHRRRFLMAEVFDSEDDFPHQEPFEALPKPRRTMMTSVTPTPTNPSPSQPTSPLDVERIRQDFPILDERVNGRPIAYLDNAATSQKPRTVLDAIRNYYEHRNANVHRGMHKLSRRATDSYEGARTKVGKWIGAASSSEVIWTRGTTEGINLVASSWGGENLRDGDVILLSDMEHHSNIVPWQLVAARTGAQLRYIELDEQGRLRLEELPHLLDDGRVKIAAITHVSNALGTINPIAEIARQVHDAGALLLVDGAQGAAHHPADVSELGADFYAFSGHKMCGPTGVGVLWGREKLLDGMPPYQGGGEMIDLVERDFSTWADLPHKFEAGTPHIAGAAAMSAAIDYLDGVGADRILAHERDLVGYALDKLSGCVGIRLFGPKSLEERAGVVSFTLEYAHPHDVSTVLDSLGIAVRAGHHCAQLVMRHFGVPATARASFYFYNTRAEVDRLVDGLDEVRSIFGDL